MKTKIVMMTALLALLATGCGKNNGDGRIRIFAENMTAAGNGSKLQIYPEDPVNTVQWIAGEFVNINGTNFEIQGDNASGYSIDIADNDFGATLYAVYPGKEDAFNDVSVTNSNTTATITLNNLALNFRDDGEGNQVHSVVFPMGVKVSSSEEAMTFKNLTAAFRLTLSAGTPVTLTKLKVIVYGTGAASAVALDGVNYTVKWADQTPSVPVGPTGSITDRDVTYASEMYFDMLTDDNPGVEVDDDLKLCIPVTLATVKRITVVGYDDSDDEVFSTTSTMNGGNVTLERNRIYPVAKITVN